MTMSDNIPKFKTLQIRTEDYRKIKKLAFKKDAKIYEIVAELLKQKDA